CRALGGRWACDRPRALGLAPCATRATRAASGAVPTGPAAECTARGVLGGPDRGLLPGRVADHLCELRIHRQSAVQPQARPAGPRAPGRHAERPEPFLLPRRTVGGVLLGQQAVQAAARWASTGWGC